MNNNFITFGLILTVLSGCGKKDSTTTSTSSNVTDTGIASGLISDQIDEATEAITDDASSGTSFAATEIAPAGAISFSKTCTEDASSGGATVVVTVSGEDSKSKTGTRVSWTKTAAVSGSESRVWSKGTNASAIKCKSSTSHIKLDWTDASNVNGLTLKVTTDRKKTMTGTLTTKKGTSTSSFEAAMKGVRTIVWSGASSSTSAVTATKTITSDVTRTLKIENSAGKSVDIAATVKTKDGAPLVVTVVRNSSGTWQSKTIASGVVVSTLEDGGKLETTFSNLKYSTSATNKCIPVSGTLTASVFEKNATTATSTSVVTFSEEGATRSIDGGTAEDFEPAATSCDLEKE